MLDRIVAEIEAEGPMPFDRYMELCLYDAEGGFFSTGPLRSTADGDFVTSPEVSPWFGRLVGRWAMSARTGPDSILVDVGAGSGSLMASMLPEVGGAFAAAYAVEVSPAARASIIEQVPDVTVVSDVNEVPPGDAVIVANELLDNVPTRIVERGDGTWSEVRVDVVDDRLRLVGVPADVDLSSWCDVHLVGVPVGSVMAAQQRFHELFAGVVRHFRSSQMALVDYGAETVDLVHRSPAEVVRAFAGHRPGRSALDDPGGTDLTVEVNIDVARAAAKSVGLSAGVIDQRAWLVSLGADEELERLVAGEYDHARDGDTMAQLRARSEAVGLRTLLDTEGLGGFSVILATTDRDA